MSFEKLPIDMADHIKDVRVTFSKTCYFTFDDGPKRNPQAVVKGLNNVIMKCNKNKETRKIMWFDDNGILHDQNIDELNEFVYSFDELKLHGKPDGLFMAVEAIKKFDKINGTFIKIPSALNDIEISIQYAKMVMITMQQNCTFSDFIERYNVIIEEGTDDFYFKYPAETLIKYSEDKELNKFIRKISNPSIERATGNKIPNTFDFIRIRIGIPPKTDSRKEFIEKHMYDLIQIVFHKLTENKRYQHYGIPVDYLTLDHAVITACDELEMVFKLKGTD